MLPAKIAYYIVFYGRYASGVDKALNIGYHRVKKYKKILFFPF